MPRPPLAVCGHDALYICANCGKCSECDRCSPIPELVSINSRKAAEAIRLAIRKGEHKAQEQ